ncbi:hypothetical protein [Marivita sp.]|uniref:hypothetical protein n=1 Tax=Marivita sp. TaxID=2003365 RepID=UPI003B515BBB
MADFGDGLRLTATVRDVGRTKQKEWCLDRGERADGPLSLGAVYWVRLPAREGAGSKQDEHLLGVSQQPVAALLMVKQPWR